MGPLALHAGGPNSARCIFQMLTNFPKHVDQTAKLNKCHQAKLKIIFKFSENSDLSGIFCLWKGESQFQEMHSQRSNEVVYDGPVNGLV